VHLVCLQSAIFGPVLDLALRQQASSALRRFRRPSADSGLPTPAPETHSLGMGTKSRESIYSASVRASSERAAEARKEADRLACEAWNKRMLGFQGPAQPSPALGDALNAGYLYLEVKCLGCQTHQTVALNIVRRPKSTPIHELERYMRCRDCSQVRGSPYKRSHLVSAPTTSALACC
jgi:hypothetical protein